MTKTVKRLSGLEIDEVSLVDRPANQHGLVTITKRDEDPGMSGLYDEHGNPVDEDQLQSGDVVFDAQGEPIQLFSDEDLEALVQSGQLDPDDIELVGQEDDERELASVGKSAAAAVTGGKSTMFQTGRKTANRFLDDMKLGFSHGRQGARSTSASGTQNVGRHFGRNGGKYAIGAAAGTEENVRGRFRKSLGEEVLTDLSKALTDGDRDQVISKMASRVEQAEYAAQEAISKAEQLEAEAEFAEYVDIAKGFDLPVDPTELGGILQAVSKVLTDEQLDTFERILGAASHGVQLDEVGSAGSSPLMGYVGEVAHELVGKSDGDVSPEQATVALFQANPEAYLDYLSEQRG